MRDMSSDLTSPSIRFLSPESHPLTDGEARHLDELGNGNGRYDVGDLRSWLNANR